jgi:hypothetical protein
MRIATVEGAIRRGAVETDMANGNPRSGSSKNSDAGTGPGSTPGVGKQGQGGESSRGERDRTADAQQEQGGNAPQQGGAGGRGRDQERPDENLQSGSSPRSRSDVPDEGKVG